MTKDFITLLIFLCICMILVLNYIFLHKYEELMIPIFLLLVTLGIKVYNIYFNLENTRIVIYESVILFGVLLLLVKYATIKKYIVI